jgi:predicted Ser/Thr protein kinase
MPVAPGAQIGPYEILALLGAGGMGEVYRGRDPRLDRTVAIKTLTSAHRTSPAQRERFQREARYLARISHPHICTLHDVGEHEGVAFLVMEFLEGDTLAERLERGALPLEQALVTAAQIAEALDALHEKGIVHRDLKPGNVMLTAGGAKLLDFGLAKLKETDDVDPAQPATMSLSLTDDGSLLGTLPYMAPEQIEGHDVDPRTDIFSFGLLLYEMVAGRRPFAGVTRASVIAAIVSAVPPSIASLKPGTPPSLERLIDRCLAKDARLRWQTIRDVATELRWIAEGGSDAPRAVPRRAGWLSRRVLAGSMVVAVVAGGLWLAPGALMPAPAPIANYVRLTYRHGGVSSARFTPDGQSVIYSASWDGQPYETYLGRPGGPDARSLALETGKILSVSSSGDMALAFGPQNITHMFGARTLGRVPLAGGARRDMLDGVVAADWIPGTNELALVRDPGGNRPWTVEFPAGNTVHTARAAWSLRVSPDGSRVAFFEGPGVFTAQPKALVTVVDRSGRRSTLTSNWAGIGLAWAPSGTEVWFTATKGVEPPALQAVTLAGTVRTVQRAPDWLMVHDISAAGRILASRNTIRVTIACQPPGEGRERDLGWRWGATVRGLSADGQTMIFQEVLGNDLSSAGPVAYRRGLDGSPAVRLGAGNPQAVSPDGKWVLTSQKDSFALLPMGAGSAVALPKGNLARVVAGAWLGDSKRIVFTGFLPDNTTRGYVQDVPDGAPRPLTPDGVFLPVKAAVRDDRTILGRSGDRWLLYPIEGGVAQPVAALAARDIPIQWSEDGRFIYTATNVGPPGRPANDVFRIELASGRRMVWKTLSPPDPVGVEFDGTSAVITPDARSYCYSYIRRLGDLFIVDGLQ